MNRLENTHRYDDIIDLPQPVSKKHPQMPSEDRAAQFSPFAGPSCTVTAGPTSLSLPEILGCIS